MNKIALTIAALMLTSTAALADTIYNNSSSVNSYIYYFGNPGTTTYGQTFIAPLADTTLNSFSLFLNGGADSGQLQGYIGTWTGTGAGAILYASSLTTVTGAAQEFTFSPNISLTGGDEYVAFLSIAGPEYGSFTGATSMPSVLYGGSIPGNGFVFQDTGGDASNLTSAPWTTNWASWEGGTDVQFIADFGSVAATPEPSSLALLGTGVLGVAGLIRRRVAA